MASVGLAQIDENSSLVHARVSDTLLLPLPTLLANSAPNTPELAERKVSLGDCTPCSPKQWPNTPTPHGRRPRKLDFAGEKTPKTPGFMPATPEAWPNTPTPLASGLRPSGGFALGEQTSWGEESPRAWQDTPRNEGTPSFAPSFFQSLACEETPMAWPEYVPSFHIDTLQPSHDQEAPMTFPSIAMNAMPFLAPMWPMQMPCPIGMVVDPSMLTAANLCAATSFPMPEVKESSGGALVAPALPVVDSSAPKAKPVAVPGKKLPARGVSQQSGEADDACPVAVYVDLSGLRERTGIPAFRRGGSRQH